MALAACQVTGSGGRAALRCGLPVVAEASSQCRIQSTFNDCSFLDKDFLAIDPAHGRLYAAFTEFSGYSGASFDAGAVEVGVCDLGTPADGTGPAGGTPAAPVCEHGTPPHKAGNNILTGKPYLTVQRADPAGCEYQGAYPAADTASGGLQRRLLTGDDTSMTQCTTARETGKPQATGQSTV
jgi:hypothetical protein